MGIRSSGNYYGPGQASRHVEFFGVGVLSRLVKRFNDYYFQVDLKFCANFYLSIRKSENVFSCVNIFLCDRVQYMGSEGR